MTLQEWNAARKWLRRMEHIGYINHKRNWLGIAAPLIASVQFTPQVDKDIETSCAAIAASYTAERVAQDLRQYRRKHRFYEPIPPPPAQVQACEDALREAVRHDDEAAWVEIGHFYARLSKDCPIAYGTIKEDA